MNIQYDCMGQRLTRAHKSIVWYKGYQTEEMFDNQPILLGHSQLQYP